MCGLVGVVGTDDSAYEAYVGLLNLQHRGQDGAGILTVDTKRNQFALQKGSGLVENVFSERSFRALRGPAAIGHTRYATIGRRDPNLLQPFLDSHSGIAIGHNGNIVNCYHLREDLLRSYQNITFASESDSEVILQLLSTFLKGESPNDNETLFAAIGYAMSELVGSYAVVGLLKNCSIFGFRDPNGVRPLFLGKKEENVYAFASETVTLDYLGYSEIEEVAPGEAVIIPLGGKPERKMLFQKSYSPCMFEWVYFARVESCMGDTSVYQARFQLGLILAEEIKKRGIEADVVLPIPETSRISAGAMAEALDLPCRELLIKNRYVQRTFLLDDQAARQLAIKRKLFPISQEIAGKRCLVVDDSIVRGNTAMQIVKLIKQAGAKDVTLVSTCPPIASPCYYGIDFPSNEELVAYNRSEEQIAKELGADRVVYQSLDGLKRALGQASLCTGCLTKEYPTDVSHGSQFEEQRNIDRGKSLSESL
ncbi:MAG: amidophosphoribosyltransferase [Candidatus Obscuribacterales bacterium]|nr:amidophosphoribosyltransferase [Candidatus Obscuribacterales bacterium]